MLYIKGTSRKPANVKESFQISRSGSDQVNKATRLDVIFNKMFNSKRILLFLVSLIERSNCEHILTKIIMLRGVLI